MFPAQQIGDYSAARGLLFVQQTLGGHDAGFGMEAALHRRIAEGVGDGKKGHALVMRHPVAHHLMALASCHARSRKIAGLEESIGR